MIPVTKLDGQKIYINEQLIQWIEERPDTVVTFLAGGRLIIREKTHEILEKVQLLKNQEYSPSSSFSLSQN